jgi:hypothetical protein
MGRAGGRPTGEAAHRYGAREWVDGSPAMPSGQIRRLACVAMATVVLRVRLTGGEHMDVTYEQPDAADAAEVIEHVIATLARMLACFAADMVTGSWCCTAGVLPPLRWRRAARSCDRRPHCTGVAGRLPLGRVVGCGQGIKTSFPRRWPP